MKSWLSLSAVLGCSSLLLACPAQERIARLSNARVVVAGKAGGGIVSQPKPIEGNPLAPSLVAGARCVPAADLLALLGPTCSHESENPPPAVASAAPVDDLEPGKPKRSDEVRWYCSGDFDLRIVFSPCDSNGDGQNDGVTPVEVAVAMHPKP